MSVRRYITVVQDPRGYPSNTADLDPAPPEGPEPPMVYSVVKADDFERLEKALHEICSCSHQDVDVPYGDFWKLLSKIHHIARRAVEPPESNG
jgi:hypothetical protein